ncbi:MAG: FxsA family protein [Microthrixaceae bacterium]|jgi:UPF0716 protein FxsA|nr:FxsA family protein [Microthrixaceae bacterium]
MGLVLLVLFVVAPLLELWVIIQVAQVIGGWETIALLVVESAIGAWLLKAQGISVLARISQAVDDGRIPDRELLDGFLLLVAGALMLAPGFVGDLLAYLLVIPPTRALFRAPLLARFKAGKLGAFSAFSASASGGRWVGSFRSSGGGFYTGDVIDTSGHDQPDRSIQA